MNDDRHKLLTPDGYARMKAKLNDLLYVERPMVVQAVSEAAAMGDRSENAEYIYGKKKLRDIDRSIRHLQLRLDGARIIHDKPADASRIFFGARAVLEDEQGDRIHVRIIGVGEWDDDSHWLGVSLNAPMSRALLGKSVDDDVSVANIMYTILDIHYTTA